MTLEETKELATKLFKEFGIEDWEFKILTRSGVRFLGRCYINRKVIEISLWHILKNPDHVEETIRHEIAHALDWIHFKKCGHGVSWKLLCIEIGANPTRVCNEATPLYRVKGTCPRCKKDYFRVRGPQRKFVCTACYKEDPLVQPLVWVKLPYASVSLKEE